MAVGRVDLSCFCLCSDDDGDGSGSGSEPVYIECEPGVRRRVPLSMSVQLSDYPSRCLWPNSAGQTFNCNTEPGDAGNYSFCSPISNDTYSLGLRSIDGNVATYGLGFLSFNDILGLHGLPIPDALDACFQDEPAIYRFVGTQICNDGSTTYTVDAYLGMRLILDVCDAGFNDPPCVGQAYSAQLQITGIYVVHVESAGSDQYFVHQIRDPDNGQTWQGETGDPGSFFCTSFGPGCTCDSTVICIETVGPPSFNGTYTGFEGSVHVMGSYL